MKKEEFKKKAKELVKKYWFPALCLVGGIVIGKTVFKTKYVQIDGSLTEIFSKEKSNFIADIVDEDVIVELAPSIKEAVLSEGLEKVYIDRTYDLGDGIAKAVKVTVEKITSKN